MQTRAVVSRATSGEERALTLAAHPLRDPDGGPGGVAAQIADLSGERHDYGRLDTLVEEEALIDRSLNVADTAQRLVDMMAARPADTATVDILDCVLRGELPRHATVGPQSLVRRVSAGTDTGERMPGGVPRRRSARLPARRAVRPPPSPTPGRMSPSWAVTTTGGCPAWSSGSWRPPERTR